MIVITIEGAMENGMIVNMAKESPSQADTLSQKPVHVIGGGLAGSEATWQLAKAGISVVLHEMRPVRGTDAHQGDGLAELVCSNSFRSDDAEFNAVGLLHAEMRHLGSLIMAAADENRVPAGSALAVDRDGFSAAVEKRLCEHPLIEIRREEITDLPTENQGLCITATGPLTSPALADAVRRVSGEDALAFFDAIAPIIHKESIDMSVAWFQSRYDKSAPGGDGKDYINCPMDKDQYDAFILNLINGEKTDFKEWEQNTPYFDGCLPIEVMAERGPETLRHGPMKPRGLTNVHDPETKAYGVVQLRQDNALGTLYNMVGFQTKLTYGEQQRVFRTIPGLENAQFARLGGLHRNTFLNSPRVLDKTLRLNGLPHIRFAGQITGCEGYVESTAIGLMTALFTIADIRGVNLETPPDLTALGALLSHITGGADADTFQPMNVNFGLFPPLERVPDQRHPKGRDRKKAMSDRAMAAFGPWAQAVRKLTSS